MVRHEQRDVRKNSGPDGAGSQFINRNSRKVYQVFLNRNEKLLLIISIFLLATGIVIYSQDEPLQSKAREPLKSQFLQIAGYSTPSFIEMPDDLVKMLKLDDYVFANYHGERGSPNLYIGYYYASTKAYAAHSPMVCYPSQGWRIEQEPNIGNVQIVNHTINLEAIITSHDTTKELVLYWYQAGRHTNTKVYRNKISMGLNKIQYNKEDHGFVRVAVPILDSHAEAYKLATDFIEAFYPQLLSYAAPSAE